MANNYRYFAMSKEIINTIRKKASNKEPISYNEASYIFRLENESLIKEVMKISKKLKEDVFGEELTFYFTGDKFPTISVTGYGCSLSCKHCKRLMLKPLHKAKTNEEIYRLCVMFYKRGALGCLLTGGCDLDGSVPIYRYTDAIKKVKEDTNLILLAHTGIIDYKRAEALAKAGLDGVSLDVVGSRKVTEEVYGIAIPEEKYKETLINLKKAGIKIISPHVTTGLYFGKLSHELNALKIIRDSITPTAIEITALMPLKGTPMEKFKPKPLDVAKVVAIAKLMFPNVEITLGCAHSKGKDRYFIEKLAIEAGVSNIAIPTERTLREFKGRIQNTCCAIPYTGV